MSGRAEKEKWYEDRISDLLNKMPRIASQFYVYFKLKSSKRTEASCYTYLNNLNIFFNYLRESGFLVDSPKAYGTIKPVDITVFLNSYRNSGKKPKGDSTVAVLFNAVKAFFSFLEDNEYIVRNPCNRLKAPRVDQDVKPVVLTKEEIERVKNCILYSEDTFYHNDQNEEYWRLRDYLVFTLGCRTGLRCSAIVAIDIKDINMDECYIIVTEKGNVTRNIYFGENTKEIINDWITARSYLIEDDSTDALFISRKRSRISSHEIWYIIKKYSSIAVPDKHITPHKMRSTCATNLWAETHDIYMVANQLGHRNLSNTKRYTDISEKESRRVANILDEL